MIEKLRNLDKEKLEALCKQHKVSAVYVFGSALTKDFNPESSDIDILVEFTEPGFDTYFSFLEGLRVLLEHENIDLVTADSLKNPVIVSEVKSSRKLIYAA